jgi:hypothetical protein
MAVSSYDHENMNTVYFKYNFTILKFIGSNMSIATGYSSYIKTIKS